MDELRELIELITENELTEFELEREGFRVQIRRGACIRRTSRAGAVPPVDGSITRFRLRHPAPCRRAARSVRHIRARRPKTAASEDQDLHMIPSPIVGTFLSLAVAERPNRL